MPISHHSVIGHHATFVTAESTRFGRFILYSSAVARSLGKRRRISFERLVLISSFVNSSARLLIVGGHFTDEHVE